MMKVTELDINEIIPYVNNPRDNTAAIDAVASSIKAFGFNVPLVLDRDKIVVTGHTRLAAAGKLGLKRVPCIIAEHLTEAQAKAYRLADNKVAELASWDAKLLTVELEELNELDMAMQAFGFEAQEKLNRCLLEVSMEWLKDKGGDVEWKVIREGLSIIIKPAPAKKKVRL